VRYTAAAKREVVVAPFFNEKNRQVPEAENWSGYLGVGGKKEVPPLYNYLVKKYQHTG